jgi:hypothetical protein
VGGKQLRHHLFHTGGIVAQMFFFDTDWTHELVFAFDAFFL